MDSTLQRRFEQLEARKEKVLSTLAGLPDAQLSHRPLPGSWCIAEVIDHLVKVEQASLALMRQHLPEGVPVPWMDRLGAWMVIAVMQTPIRVKVPRGAEVVVPEPAPDLEQCALRWTETRREVRQLMEPLQGQQLRRGFFRHPVSGWMNMADTLRFLAAHIRHHEFQLDRVLSRRN